MVSSVSFGTRSDLYNKPDLNAPQANQRQEAATAPANNTKPKKKHTAAKVIFGTLAAAAVVAAALAVGNKNVGAIKGFLENAADKPGLKWVNNKDSFGRKVLSGLNKAGEYINDKASKVAESVTNFFKRSPKEKDA